MHNAVLIAEHTGADLLKILLRECDCAALCILIHWIQAAAGGGALIPQLLSQWQERCLLRGGKYMHLHKDDAERKMLMDQPRGQI